MRKNIIIIFIISCFLISCFEVQKHIEDAKEYTYKDFGNPINLEGEILSIEDIWKPTRISCRDSFLILTESTDKYLIHIYNKKNGIKVAKNIPHGIGPNERLNSWSLQYDNENIWSFDMMTGTMTSYPESDFFANNDVLPKKTIRFKDGATGIIHSSNNQFVMTTLSDVNSLLTVYNADGIIDSTIRVPYPKVYNTVIPANLAKRFFENRIYYNEEANKIVLFYVYTDLIEVYDTKFTLLARLQGPDKFIPELSVREIDGKKHVHSISNRTKFAYLSGWLTENEIWTLYYGVIPEAGKELQNRIFVYDYMGKPLRSYNLDLSISAFCVDTEGIIYGLSEQPEPCVIRFKT